MAESFVSQGTHIICTNMTSTIPQTIQAPNENITIPRNKNEPLLTILDNKISGTLSCKVPAKFWGGLAMLAAGIAIGAAIVLTGGLAAAVIVTAMAVSAAAGVTMIVKAAHDCDATLDARWKLYHTTVKIQGKSAILNRSTLCCPKGGILNIIISPVIAHNAADRIGTNNTIETGIQMGSQLVMGFISGLTLAAGIVPLVATALLTPLGYWSGEDKLIAKKGLGLSDDTADTPFVGGSVEAAAATASGTVAPGLLTMSTGYIAYGAGVIVRKPGTQLLGAAITSIGKTNLKEGLKFSNMKDGLIAAAANLVIGELSDMWEKSYEDETRAINEDMNRQDRNNGIGIKAITM